MMSVEEEAKFRRRRLCCEIDQTLLDFFSTLTSLYQEQSALEKLMKSGFINLSRARYTMGIKNVGIQQCDENNMSATVKVRVEDGKFECDDSADLVCKAKNSRSDNSEFQVRHRNVMRKTEDDFEVIENVQDIKLDDVEDKDHSKEASSKVCDPLKWFGVLVPGPLRQSQKDFRSTTDIILSIANLKVSLTTLQEKYMDLLTKKKELNAEGL